MRAENTWEGISRGRRGNGGGGDNPQKTFASMAGTWMSGCIESEWRNGNYRMIAMRITANEELEYDKYYFADSNCTQVREGQEELYVGEMLTEANLGSGKYAVKYKLPIDNNAWTWKNFNIKKQNNTLKISEFYGSFDDASEVPLTITLRPVTSDDEESEEDEDSGNFGPLVSGSYAAVGGDMWTCTQVIST